MAKIKMKKPWRDYEVGDIVDALNDRICEELILSEFAERCENEGIDEFAQKSSLGLSMASLKSAELMIAFHEKELERLKEKKEIIEKDIEKKMNAETSKTETKKSKLNRKEEV